ncbi:MAG: hypothetical protein EXS35_12850 [Pedosphaera sp.]|nr:hypothetical protein [Pedosphaera sp.]
MRPDRKKEKRRRVLPAAFPEDALKLLRALINPRVHQSHLLGRERLRLGLIAAGSARRFRTAFGAGRAAVTIFSAGAASAGRLPAARILRMSFEAFFRFGDLGQTPVTWQDGFWRADFSPLQRAIKYTPRNFRPIHACGN